MALERSVGFEFFYSIAPLKNMNSRMLMCSRRVDRAELHAATKAFSFVFAVCGSRAFVDSNQPFFKTDAPNR
jgi:hypothetical protein